MCKYVYGCNNDKVFMFQFLDRDWFQMIIDLLFEEQKLCCSQKN